MNYVASIGGSKYHESSANILKKFKIDTNTKVSQLSVDQKHIVNIAIGLSKDPDLILYDDPISQFDTTFYSSIMNAFYDIIVSKDKGITLLSTVTNPELQSRFPGRLIP